MVSKQRQLLGPISVVHRRCRRLRSSFTTEAKKQKPAWTCVMLRCCTHHTLQQLRRHTAMAAGFSEVHRRRPSPRASTATLFQCSRRGVFLFPRPMKIGTIFVSPQLRSLLPRLAPFLITLIGKIDLLLLVDQFLFFEKELPFCTFDL